MASRRAGLALSDDPLGPSDREDFPDIYLGPHNLLRGLAFYPPSQHAGGAYLDPPSAPVVLAALGLMSRSHAGAIFVLVSVGAFIAGLYRLASRTTIPGLTFLGLDSLRPSAMSSASETQIFSAPVSSPSLSP